LNQALPLLAIDIVAMFDPKRGRAYEESGPSVD
jgi:hypothetical protein